MKYYFGGIKEFNLEQIESEVLSESVYLDVFAGSDLRLKENVKNIPSVLSQLSQLDAVSFTWKQDILDFQVEGKGAPQVGVIAQQVAEVFPELVRRDEKSGFLTVNYTKMTTHLLAGLQELNQIIQSQEARIKELESKLV
jgi:Chaperone of endosialidase